MKIIKGIGLLLTLVAAMFFYSCTSLTEVEDRLDVLEEEVLWRPGTSP